MNDHAHNTNVPRLPLLGAAFLIVASLLLVAMVRLTGFGASHVEDSEAVMVRELRFEDRADGSIAVLDAREGNVVYSVAPGTNGFLRGTMRGLARERKRQGSGPEYPFRLIGHTDGRLTLEDPATGRRIDLESFGPTNAAVFSRLLVTEGRSQ